MSKKIKITQIKSSIGYRKRTKATLIALGMKKINDTVIKNEDSAIKGMVDSVRHLIKIEDVK